MADTKTTDNPSMEDILNTIRGVISDDDEGTPTPKDSAQDASAPTPKNDEPEPKPAEEKKTTEEPPQEASPPPASVDEEDSSNNDDNDDVLELTDMVEEPTQTPEQPEAAAPTTPAVETDDDAGENILDNLDNMLGEDANDAPAAEVPAAEPVAETAPAEPAAETPAPAAPTPEAEPMIEAMPQPEAPKDEPQARQDRVVSEQTAATSQAVLKEMMENMPKRKVESPAMRSGTTLEDLVIEAIRPYLVEWMDKNLATIVKQLVEKEIKHLIPRDVE